MVEALTRAGRYLGYRVQTEYPVQGGRIDVVWLTDLPSAFGTDRTVIAAFEVESSWRTRKHLKGDYLNLFHVGGAVGVLILPGEGADIDATRTSPRYSCTGPVPGSWSGAMMTSTDSWPRSKG